MIVPGGGTSFSTLPDDPNPDGGKGIPFSIEVDENFGAEFKPVYYPDRYTDTMKKKIEEHPRQCEGEEVVIDSIKNPEFHASGIVIAENVSDFRDIRSHNGPVILNTPLTDNFGGMEVIVKKGEIGEIHGWDGMYEQWQFKYTIDMIGSGGDAENTGENQIVSEALSSWDNKF